jgi:parvulin-like peptidyl-prolyl isomerase
MTRRSFLGATLALVSIASLAAAAPQSKAVGAKKSTGTVARTDDNVAALVNGERIMLSDLIARLDELGVAPEQREHAGNTVLDAMVDSTLLVQFLAKQKIAYDAKAVDAEIAKLRAEYEKQGVSFATAIAKLGLTEAKLRASAVAEAQWQAYVKERVSDKDLSDHFAKYREYFDGSEVRASHILIEVPDGAAAAVRAAAKAKADRIRKELAAGADFAASAKKYSECPSKDQGGDVGSFPRHGKVVEPFARAAFSLKIGQMSEVVETDFGYHIIKATDRKPGTRLSLKDPTLRADLIHAIGDHMKESIIAELRKTAKIEIAPGVDVPAPARTKTATQPTNKVKK